MSSPCNALKARSQLQCPSGKIAARNHVFPVDARKPRGLIMTETIRCWCCGGYHHGHDHGNHEGGRETAHLLCHGGFRLNFQVRVYSMPKLDASLERTCSSWLEVLPMPRNPPEVSAALRTFRISSFLRMSLSDRERHSHSPCM